MSNEIFDNNHFVVNGWMRTQLNLKGNELFVYALIYGFSQDGQSEFYGSRAYISKWLDISLPTVDKALDGLIKKKLINKRVETTNNVNFNRYKANLQVVKNFYHSTKNNSDNGSKEILHNKEIKNEKEIYNNIIAKFGFSESIINALYEWLDYKKEKNQTYKEKGLEALCKSLLLMKNNNNDEFVVNAINHSMCQNYAGIYPLKNNTQTKNNNAFRSREYTKEQMDNLYDSLDDIEI